MNFGKQFKVETNLNGTKSKGFLPSFSTENRLKIIS